MIGGSKVKDSKKDSFLPYKSKLISYHLNFSGNHLANSGLMGVGGFIELSAIYQPQYPLISKRASALTE